MKTSGELERLDRIANDAENDFWMEAENTATSLITSKCENVNGVYSVDVDELFGYEGRECRVMTATEIVNDEVSGPDESKCEWEVEEIRVENGALTIQCEGNEFDLDNFERHDVIRLVKLLEKMGEASR